MSAPRTGVGAKATFESWLAVCGLLWLPAAVLVAVAGATPSIRPAGTGPGVRVPDQRWRSRTFDRRVDAQRWLTNELAKLDRGEWVDPCAGRTSFSSVAERWMAGRVALREGTQARDRSYLNSLILPTFGTRPVGSIQPSDLEV